MIKYLSCILMAGLLTVYSAFSQSAETPHHYLVYKLKSEGQMLENYPFFSPKAELPSEIWSSIAKNAPKVLFPANHTFYDLSQARKALGQRSKALSLLRYLELKPEVALEDALQILRNQGFIAYAEPLYKHQALYVPNDPAANPSSAPAQFHLVNIQAYDAWDIQQGNSNVVIGITDNGADLSNPDLSSNFVLPSTSFADLADGDNDVSGGGHGTFVALFAAAKPDNNYGGAGIGFNCHFLPIKVASNADLNSYIAGYEGSLLAAMHPNCEVVNMSWGRTGDPSFFEADVLRTIIEDYDVVPVAAAGNENNTTYYYPAAYGNLVLAVGATNSSDQKASFSTFNDEVDLCAPGENVHYGTGTNSGTSFAAPMVAGAIALLRAEYPNLSVEQVMNRIKNTTDNIYGIAGNDAYLGQLGTGRLNVYRALNDMFISVQDYSLSNAERGYLFRGFNSNMTLNFRNEKASSISNLNISITCSSPYVTLTNNSFTASSVAGNSLFDNSSNPLNISIDNSTPANTEITLLINFDDGVNNAQTQVKMLINPGHSDINLAKFTVSDNGVLAVYDESYEALYGFSYEDDPALNPLLLLKEAGLIIAQSEDRLSSAVRSSAGVLDDDFTRSITLSQQNISADNRLETYATFEDITDNVGRLGVEIQQNTYAWSGTGLEKGLVIEYKIENLGVLQDTLENVYAGIFADWDINDFTQNRADWDESEKLGFVYNTALVGRLYAGIALISNQNPNYYAFGESTPLRSDDTFTDAEKWQAISSGILQDLAGASGENVSHLISGEIPAIRIGDAQSIAFALVVGESLSDLQTSVQNIRAKFIELKTSPTPVQGNVQVCAGESLLIQPSNGNRFRFYTLPPSDPSAVVIHEGGSLFLNNITSSSTFYVTGIDSLYESAALAFEVSIDPHENSFDLPNDEQNIALSNTLNLTGISADATQWFWEISLNGGEANAAISFGNGTNANSQNPQIVFSQTGSYTIRLTTQNAAGCSFSQSQDLFIFRDITTDITQAAENGISLYPNPARDWLWLELSPSAKSVTIEILDYMGKTQKQFVGTRGLNQLSLAGLPAGLYLLRLQVGESRQVYKIIKQ